MCLSPAITELRVSQTFDDKMTIQFYFRKELPQHFEFFIAAPSLKTADMARIIFYSINENVCTLPHPLHCCTLNIPPFNYFFFNVFQ